jgi:EPS-associated MarR family transcriptional regulator|tara:strand:- start:1219 stop:1533 length:315 start_codon:yes stop_codon:yes gene_type:complete
MNNNQDHFEVLRKINNSDKATQRKLANELGFSLGKLNYCIKSLKDKGFIKIYNFKKNPNKLKYAYILTPRGITQKTKMTISFMKRKIKEYDELEKELKRSERTK